MREKPLGRSGPNLSVIGLGTIEAIRQYTGDATPHETLSRAISAALEAGVSWIDTAELYDEGRGEELIGQAVAGCRADVLLCTKVAPRVGSIAWGGSGFQPDEISAACRASLRRLGTDWIDIYLLHAPDESGIPLEDTWGAMSALVDDGLVRFIGLSNFTQPLIEQCMEIRHVDTLENEFSMMNLTDGDLARWCGDHGVGFLCYAPLSYGLLAGTIRRDDPADAYWRQPNAGKQFAPDLMARNFSLVDRLRMIGERIGVSLAQLALAWTVEQPGVTAAIAGGAANPDYIRENAKAGDVELRPDVLREIEQLSQAPSS